MKLSMLLKSVPQKEIYNYRQSEIKHITEDSRNVYPNSIFIAIKGITVDGYNFIPEVIKKGVKVIVGETNYNRSILKDTTYIKVKNARICLGLIASQFFNNPSQKLKVIGITGTDGKTTTASLIYHILSSCGLKAGLITTIGAKIGRREIDTGLHVTSPDTVTIHRLLGNMYELGCKYAVCEVTSHGLDQERVAAVSFDSSVLTNITHEHLDYHKTHKAYINAKAKLFSRTKNFVVLNKDDKSFDFIRNVTVKEVKLLTYAIMTKNADYYVENIRSDDKGTYFELKKGADTYHIYTKLLGNYNIYNILAALVLCSGYNIPIEKIIRSVSTFIPPKGRLEEVKNNRGFEIYIDFAHTPNSLEKVLTTLKSRIENRKLKSKLIVVFGCAGERDIKKRSLMGNIAGKIANVSIITTEDPRSEDVNKIIKQIEKGAQDVGAIKVDYSSYNEKDLPFKNIYINIPERGEAISFAINNIAHKNDTIIICGKGHEKSMAYGNTEYPWSDQDAIKEAIKGRVKRLI